MKLVIYTQYRENYGDAESPHWKNKGGSVYVILDTAATSREEREELRDLVEYSNEMSDEYLLSTRVVGDDEVVCDEWEAPIYLTKIDGRWSASVVHKNDGQFRDEIASKSETWTMLPEGVQTDYAVTYKMVDGQTLNDEGLREFYRSRGN